MAMTFHPYGTLKAYSAPSASAHAKIMIFDGKGKKIK
jgi:hypothetical protein